MRKFLIVPAFIDATALSATVAFAQTAKFGVAR